MEKEVTILKDCAQMPDCDLYHSKNDSILWINPMDEDYYADFRIESPFEKTYFTIKANSRESSGPLKKGAQAKHYHYDLAPVKVGEVVAAGAPAADPTVIVH